ncbi:MAG: FAD-dependent oxidoreductase [Acidobacteria bacterium]|nr:FAD-dependent oxidoreductase [Acidobacteriota bacterium]
MSRQERLVVIGNGMAGARFVEDVRARSGGGGGGGGDRYQITVFGDEPHGNYNRILLSSVLAGSHDSRDIFINPLSWYAANGVALHAGVRADAIDVPTKTVTGAGAAGRIVEPYDTLVIATGSAPFVPRMSGLTNDTGGFVPGVFLFRTLDDCDRMLAYAAQARTVAVIGGGLLGLEAARGLLNRGLEVHVVHLMPHLMEAQLDAPAAAVLQRQLVQMGFHLHLETVTAAVLGAERVTGLVFQGGSTLECDMVVISAGIRPNVDVAFRAGLEVERGIVIGDDLACRPAPDVYAIGECAQHRGRVYGLVAPVWEQAQVLADRLTGSRPQALYRGSRTSTKLKVAGVDVAVMGDKEPAEDDDEVVSYAEPARGVYKKLIVRKNRLAGAIVLGDPTIVPSLVMAFADAKALTENRAELLFSAPEAARLSSAESIPDTAQICDCNAVSKAQIIQAVLEGARGLKGVSDATRACTGCGSCKPEVERIVALACQGLMAPEVLAAPERTEEPAATVPDAGPVVVTLNKIERFKREKDGLDILADVPRLANEGWEAINEGDRERLKWAGIFFRRQTPGRFMMRVRISNGMTNAAQVRTLAEITRECGVGFADITTRQQIQLRGFEIGQVPAIWDRLEAVGLATLQTGQDNIRNVVGCPAAGLTPHELFDASPVARQFTAMFLRDKAYTNLPRKFNVAITGCTEQCVHAETQDVALTPALKTTGGAEVKGFNVAVGGKIGSGGHRLASALDVFVAPEDAASLCSHITLIFRDHGLRAARNRARLAFLIEDWGVKKFRAELQRRMGRPLPAAGRDMRGRRTTDHLGIVKQRQAGLNYVGLAVPVGRITADQLFDVARLADRYGNGDIRITTSQNLIVPNVPDENIAALTDEPLLRALPHDPSEAMRGLVSCTGIDYCHFALIETKELALKTARGLEAALPPGRRLTMHWSGCPAGCGNHAAADIGLLGKNIRVDGALVDAVDIFIGGRSGPDARPGTKILEDVPCEELPQVLERVIPYLSSKRPVAAASPAAGATPRATPPFHAHT